MAQLLIVEDEPDISLALQVLLRRQGHTVAHAVDGPSGLRAVHDTRPELVVLDIGLPRMDGWEVLHRIRDISDVPVLLLTAAGRDEDKIRGLRAGADDYLTKPFNNGEFLARVEALLRRAGDQPYDGTDLRHGDIVLSPSSHLVTVAGEPVGVSVLEFRLLAIFLRHPGQVLTPQQLLSLAWDDASAIGTDKVKFAVMRLRKKLNWDDPLTSPLSAVRGVGYRLDNA